MNAKELKRSRRAVRAHEKQAQDATIDALRTPWLLRLLSWFRIRGPEDSWRRVRIAFVRDHGHRAFKQASHEVARRHLTRKT